jgi:hypothetical protein
MISRIKELAQMAVSEYKAKKRFYAHSSRSKIINEIEAMLQPSREITDQGVVQYIEAQVTELGHFGPSGKEGSSFYRIMKQFLDRAAEVEEPFHNHEDIKEFIVDVEDAYRDYLEYKNGSEIQRIQAIALRKYLEKKLHVTIGGDVEFASVISRMRNQAGAFCDPSCNYSLKDLQFALRWDKALAEEKNYPIWNKFCELLNSQFLQPDENGTISTSRYWVELKRYLGLKDKSRTAYSISGAADNTESSQITEEQQIKKGLLKAEISFWTKERLFSLYLDFVKSLLLKNIRNKANSRESFNVFDYKLLAKNIWKDSLREVVNMVHDFTHVRLEEIEDCVATDVSMRGVDQQYQDEFADSILNLLNHMDINETKDAAPFAESSHLTSSLTVFNSRANEVASVGNLSRSLSEDSYLSSERWRSAPTRR